MNRNRLGTPIGELIARASGEPTALPTRSSDSLTRSHGRTDGRTDEEHRHLPAESSPNATPAGGLNESTISAPERGADAPPRTADEIRADLAHPHVAALLIVGDASVGQGPIGRLLRDVPALLAQRDRFVDRIRRVRAVLPESSFTALPHAVASLRSERDSLLAEVERLRSIVSAVRAHSKPVRMVVERAEAEL